MKKIKMRTLNTFTNNRFKVGDFILFQEYTSDHSSQTKVSKPIYAIYMGYDIWDMAALMKYVHVPKEYNTAQSIQLFDHIEWNDYVDILGHWRSRPKWKSLIKAYRKYEKRALITNSDFEVR